jgi:hypothetical protein
MDLTFSHSVTAAPGNRLDAGGPGFVFLEQSHEEWGLFLLWGLGSWGGMKWSGRRQSSNVEDRRGMSPRGRTVIGGGLGIVLIIAFAIFTDTDPMRLLDALSVEQGTCPPVCADHH